MITLAYTVWYFNLNTAFYNTFTYLVNYQWVILSSVNAEAIEIQIFPPGVIKIQSPT